MVDKKNLADIVERLMNHLSGKAEGHYKTQLVSKLITIAAQRDYKYVTDFEWYIDVLVRLTRVPGNEQGKLIADQFLDVAVRVEAVRRFAVKQMILLLQDQLFYNSQSLIVEVLYAAAWIAGEFASNKVCCGYLAKKKKKKKKKFVWGDIFFFFFKKRRRWFWLRLCCILKCATFPDTCRVSL
jgi:hypothetical protein